MNDSRIRRAANVFARLWRERKQSDEAWRKQYYAALNSPHWKKVRVKVLARDIKCQMCLERAATQVHHLTYEMLGCEPCHHLIGVCDRCHEFYHNYSRNKHHVH